MALPQKPDPTATSLTQSKQFIEIAPINGLPGIHLNVVNLTLKSGRG